MGKLVVIGMADMNIVHAPDSIVTYGLGSCVGVTLYDARRKIAGMAHVMLPDSSSYTGQINKAKFMDTAITELLAKLAAVGVTKSGLVAKVAGGAHMFGLTPQNDTIKVGQRNGEMAIKILQKLSIPIVYKELGGTFGRTITVDAESGALTIKTVGHGEKIV